MRKKGGGEDVRGERSRKEGVGSGEGVGRGVGKRKEQMRAGMRVGGGKREEGGVGNIQYEHKTF